MKKLIEYKLDKDILFCPISLNNSILMHQPSKGGTNIKIEEYIVLKIFSLMTLNPSRLYIVDFSGIAKLELENKNLVDILQYTNTVLYFERKKYLEICELVNQERYMTFEDEKGSLVYNSNTEQRLIDYLSVATKNEKDFIKSFHSHIYADFFIQEANKYKHKYPMEELKYLESSNVYVNCYINIKAIFSQPEYMYLVISDLTELIRNNFPDLTKVCLLGVSNNGIILSRLIGYQLELEAKSINHLGPKYSLESDKELLFELKNKKFILVSDVICLGGEYRLAKGILNVLNSRLLGAVSVVKIKNVYRGGESETTRARTKGKEDKICTLLNNINEYTYEGESLNYTIYIDREEKDE